MKDEERKELEQEYVDRMNEIREKLKE